MDQNLVPVSSVVEEWNVDPCSCRTARLVAHRPRSKRTAALDGRHRYPPRTRRVERWRHFPQPGRPRRPDQRCQAHCLRGRHGSTAMRESCSRFDVRGERRRADTRRPRLNRCRRTAGTRARGPRHAAVRRHAVVGEVQLRGPTGWVGRATAQRVRRQGLSPHPPRLAGRGGPRPPRAKATSGALLREHRDFGHRMAARRLHLRGPSGAVLNS